MTNCFTKCFRTFVWCCIDRYNKLLHIQNSESRLKDEKIDWQSNLVDIPGYKLLYDNSKTGAGGVALYVNDAIKDFKVMSELKLKLDDCESIFTEIYFTNSNSPKNTNSKRTILLGCIYRHPRYATSVFLQQLFEKLSTYSEKNIPILILGDINLDTLEQNERAFNYINTLSSVGCKNLINVPTCFTNLSQTCLDHVVTNLDTDITTYGVLDETPTDHLPVYVIYKNRGDSCKTPNKNEALGIVKVMLFSTRRSSKNKDTFLSIKI